MTTTATLVADLKAAGQDFEWYPTTPRMVDRVVADLKRTDNRVGSVMDIGAGDGRVLLQFQRAFEGATLYSIERSTILQQAQPEVIVPVGADFFEQNLMALPCDVIFCNPPYSEYEEWTSRIIATAHADVVYLVIPQRWQGSALIAGALTARGVTGHVIHTDDFFDAERAARAVINIVRVRFTETNDRGWGRTERPDPFDAWFDANIDTFEHEAAVEDPQSEAGLARINQMRTITELVEAFEEDYARMEQNYKAIFRLDLALLKELGVNKDSVRAGLKKRMAGLKHVYWDALFRKLDVVTSRLTTKTKKGFLDRLNGQTAVAFTASNAYAVVLWAIKAANQYFDQQVVEVFRALSTHDGVANYVSNQRTWIKHGWRYQASEYSHYRLDYRVVLDHYAAIQKSGEFRSWDYPNGLHRSGHEQVDDLVAVFSNLGFRVQDRPTWERSWVGGQWQDFRNADGDIVFQVKGYQNGNLHFRFMPDAIKALNIEAGRLLGWLGSPADVVTELGYTAEEAARYFGASLKLGPSAVKQLTGTAGAV